MASHYLVCVAGFCDEVVDEIKARPAARFTEEAGNPPIIFPLRAPYIYDASLAEKYKAELCKRLSGIPHSDNVGIILILSAHRPDKTDQFIDDFFPFAFAREVAAFYPDRSPKDVRRNELKSAVTGLEQAARGARAAVRQIWDHFAGRNFSPLLLPVNNFHSDVLPAEVGFIYSNIGRATDPIGIIKNSSEAILGVHPIQNRGEGKYFEDERRLRFFSPGKNRHGFARNLSEGHKVECFLSSRVRFGGGFDALFHYDCVPERGPLNRDYPNCHSEPTPPAANTHVNIAPNDYVR